MQLHLDRTQRQAAANGLIQTRRSVIANGMLQGKRYRLFSVGCRPWN